MADRLVRFGVAMEESLLKDFDRVVSARGSTRSEAFRDLARGAVVRAEVGRSVPAVASLTLVYDHHVRDLTEKLTELQHELGEDVRAALHVHLDHDYCLEVIVMRGRSDQLQTLADKILGMRGVKHGDIEIITGLGESRSASHHHSTKTGHESSNRPKRRKRSQAIR